MQELPIGMQDFGEVRKKNFLYIDKTPIIYQLLAGKYFFLSRPRRFGKSLLISTLRELFLGNQELFKGLWIEDKIEWEKYPVIHLDFSISAYKEIGLLAYLKQGLVQIAQEYEIQLEQEAVSFMFEELILKLAAKYKQQVVILIDEYDKPIIDFLGKSELPQAIENRGVLKMLYSAIKSLDASIRFLFITGVSKFSKVSIFSDLNNLTDISMHPAYQTLVGCTQTELENYFEEYLESICEEQNIARPELLATLKNWYNGYDFVGESKEKVYNPFSLLNYMSARTVSNYWFSTGTPTFLTKKLAEEQVFELKDIEIDLEGLGKMELEHLDIISLLYQTGYLTITGKVEFDIYTLDYPNQEVRNSMLRFLLVEYAHTQDSQTKPLVSKLKRAFQANDIPLVFKYLNALFAKIPYQIFEERLESYYHSILFLTFTMLGYYTQAEVQTAEGRIDAVVETEDRIFILEFKVKDSAENALKQIKEKKYYQKYQDSHKEIYLIGVACQEKQLNEYLVEKV